MCNWGYTHWRCQYQCPNGGYFVDFYITADTACYPCRQARNLAKAAGHPFTVNMNMRDNPYTCKLGAPGYKHVDDMDDIQYTTCPTCLGQAPPTNT